MWHWIFKIAVSSSIILLASELSKRSGWLGGLIASLPLVSILTLIWAYQERPQIQAIVTLSYGILWFIIPSLVLFISLPLLLNHGVSFYKALGISCGMTMAAYAAFYTLLQRLGISLS